MSEYSNVFFFNLFPSLCLGFHQNKTASSFPDRPSSNCLNETQQHFVTIDAVTKYIQHDWIISTLLGDWRLSRVLGQKLRPYHQRQAAGFIGVDEIRMLLKKIPSLIFLFNFYIYIILVLKINNSIISALKIMNLNILLLNFLKCIIGEYVRLNHARCLM